MSRKHHRHNGETQPTTVREEIAEAFLYVIQCKDENGFVKIGITNENPSGRVNQLQTGNPYELLLIAAFPISGKKRHFIESTIHKQLETFSLRGEWFKLTAKQAVTFLVGSLNLFEEETPQPHREEREQPHIEEQEQPRLTAKETYAMIRNQSGLTQVEFATKAGVSLSKLKKAEVGRARFSDDELTRMSNLIQSQQNTQEAEPLTDKEIRQIICEKLNRQEMTLSGLANRLGINKGGLYRFLRENQTPSKFTRSALASFIHATEDTGGVNHTTLLTVALESCGNDKKVLADRSGVSVSLIKEIQAGRRRITADTRQKFERVLHDTQTQEA